MERSSLLASRAAKTVGRTLQGSGPLEGSSLLVSRAAKPWQGRTWKGRHFWLEGRETVARAYSRGLWR